MKSFTQLAPIMALVVIAPNGASAARSCFEVLKEMQALVNSGMFGVPVPKCEANGDWFPLQCHSSTGMCFCVHPNGDTLADPTRSLRMCKCFQHRHKVLTSGLVGAHVPTCENDSGFYKKA
ncbi:thyroglobulin isoform 1, partial [Tropilaelaps mercedesae]